ncbi:MAG: hypothetical protein NTY38_09160, partial [Acidobacteria bacterium]|nr:hypothetical protein [Acidobacteriota bacterium]
GGLAGMNFAFLGRPELYHHALDDAAHLDRSSVQENGRYALALARRLGNADLRRLPGGDAVYFPTRLTSLIVYPVSWMLPLAVLTAMGLAAAMWLGWRRKARGVWVGWPLTVVAALLFLTARPVPGISYLFQWPLAAGVTSLALLVTAEENLQLGWRTVALMLLPAGAILVLVEPLPQIVLALGWPGAATLVAGASLLALIGVLPQLVLVFRRLRM